MFVDLQVMAGAEGGEAAEEGAETGQRFGEEDNIISKEQDGKLQGQEVAVGVVLSSVVVAGCVAVEGVVDSIKEDREEHGRAGASLF